MHNDLIRLALTCGAANAAVLPAAEITLSASFRDICATNACGCYGKCWMCPPDIGDIEALMAQIDAYSTGLLYQTISPLEDSFDYEGMVAAGHSHAQMSQRLEQAIAPLLPARLHLSCGGCRLCERCARRDNLPCRHPESALPPMEGYGIDVYNTAKAAGLKYINGQNTVTYFGIVLF